MPVTPSTVLLSEQEILNLSFDISSGGLRTTQNTAFDPINKWINVSMISAFSNLIDTMTSYDTTDAIMNGVTALVPQFAVITASSSGVTNVVAAVTSKKIRVLAFVLTSNAAVNAKFQSHVTPTDLTGLLYMGASGVLPGAYNPKGHFQTLSGEALDINLSGAVTVGGWMIYVAL